MTGVAFEYWSDPLCIWALVSQPKLEHVLELHHDALVPTYRIVPVFGSIRERFATGVWSKAGPAGRAATTQKIAREHGREDVSGECWLRDCPATSWPAGAAAKAVFAMAEQGEVSAETAARYLIELREWFFVQDRNVTRRDEQLTLAEALDVPRASLSRRLDDGSALCALYEDHDARHALGVRGSPTYLFDGGRATIYGNFSVAVLTATVRELVDGGRAGGSAC